MTCIIRAFRMLAKSPAMVAIAALTLTLGIGVPAIMFTIVNGVFRELPVEDPDQIIRLFQTDLKEGGKAGTSHTTTLPTGAHCRPASRGWLDSHPTTSL